MAILRAYQSLDMNRYDVRHTERTIISNEVVRFGADGDSIAYFGAIWHPYGFEPSGTLRGVSVEEGGFQHFAIYDFERPVRQPFVAMQLAGDSRAFFRLLMQEDDVLQGSRQRDTLNGYREDDLVKGARGKDVLKGGGGEDVLQGGRGRDVLLGGNGDDRLNGGQGDDKMRGGQGEDVFVFWKGAGDDVIRDFDDGRDQIRISSRGTLDFDDLTIRGDGDDVVVTIDGAATITLRHMSPAEIGEDDFLFG
ncbi:calcium-binding protein [Albimonas sp. CAU 1670]|uniref:calcium-binding protein n=1 Tax=Albimonas sp. CAU 1670 TaxID=3032599 RepID=UPI0023DB5511|nr:calcium-binding protein [Albimonas sp. CAU 1670]MDF2234646.1 calcium-binding protein [Albimonas sp. CAU 1670]